MSNFCKNNHKANGKFALLTSGGDCPGMNNLVAHFMINCHKGKLIPCLIKDGFKGIIEKTFLQKNICFAYEILNQGGSSIGCSRFVEFKEKTTQRKAISILNKEKIDALIIAGGEGSIKGAKALSNLGFRVIAIPATIDNDVEQTSFTLGFDSTLNNIVHAIDLLRHTAESHNRCFILQVMGRDCGDLAFYSGLASGCEVVSWTEQPLTVDEIVQQVNFFYQKKKRSVIVLVSEHLYNLQDLASRITKEVGYETRVQELGHLQRGGIPSAFDRFHAWNFISAAFEVLKKKEDNNSYLLVYRNNNYDKIPL